MIKKTVSEARTRLVEIIDAKSAATAAMAGLQASIARLSREQEAPAKIEEEIRRLDIGESAAMAAWAKTGEGDAPRPDSARETLTKALSEARASAAAAASAKTGIEAALRAEAMKLPEMDAWANAAIATIVAETMAPMVDLYKDMARGLASKAEQLAQGGEFLLRLAEGSPQPIKTQILRELEGVNGKLSRAFARPAPDDDKASLSRGAWRELVASLASDANATLRAV